jgi:ribosome modulation factor
MAAASTRNTPTLHDLTIEATSTRGLRRQTGGCNQHAPHPDAPRSHDRGYKAHVASVVRRVGCNQHAQHTNAPRSHDRGYQANVTSVVRRGGELLSLRFCLAVCAINITLLPSTAGPAKEFPGPQPIGNH